MSLGDRARTELPYDQGGPVPITPEGFGRTTTQNPTPSDETPAIDEAISSIGDYNFNSRESDEEALALLMMFSP